MDGGKYYNQKQAVVEHIHVDRNFWNTKIYQRLEKFTWRTCWLKSLFHATPLIKHYAKTFLLLTYPLQISSCIVSSLYFSNSIEESIASLKCKQIKGVLLLWAHVKTEFLWYKDGDREFYKSMQLVRYCYAKISYKHSLKIQLYMYVSKSKFLL